MEILIVSSVEAVESVVVQELLEFIETNPQGRLGVATGRTFERIYGRLTEKAAAAGIPLSGLSVFLLDEYVGLPQSHPQRFRNLILRQLADNSGLDPSQVFAPNSDEADLAVAGEDFEAAIQAKGGIQLQLLGVGRTGHIGFNEPGSAMRSRTRTTTLLVETREDNAPGFGPNEAVPTHAITQGIGTILDAHRILLVATGKRKAPIVKLALEGPISASVPASAIQSHERVAAILDADAASKLERGDYYRHAHLTTSAGQIAWHTGSRPAEATRPIQRR